MTEFADSTTKSRFDAAKANFDAARAAASAVQSLDPCEASKRILKIMDATAAVFFNTPAPSLGAVAQKLESYWSEELLAENDEAKHKRALVGDMRRLERTQAGIGEPEASGGMDPDEIANEWAAALQEYTSRESSSEVRSRLLSTPAPDCTGLVQKMELLSAESATRGLTLILRDLRRFATGQTESTGATLAKQ